MKSISAQKRGFTLIELIIVIAIIAIIIAAVFVALDPVRRLNAARNSRRRTDVTSVAQALSLAATDASIAGETAHPLFSFFSANDEKWYMIGGDADPPTLTGAADTCLNTTLNSNCDATITLESGCLSLKNLTGSGYLQNIPRDPTLSNASIPTGYAVKYEDGVFEVAVCNPDGEGAGGSDPTPTIQVAR